MLAHSFLLHSPDSAGGYDHVYSPWRVKSCAIIFFFTCTVTLPLQLRTSAVGETCSRCSLTSELVRGGPGGGGNSGCGRPSSDPSFGLALAESCPGYVDNNAGVPPDCSNCRCAALPSPYSKPCGTSAHALAPGCDGHLVEEVHAILHF